MDNLHKNRKIWAKKKALLKIMVINIKDANFNKIRDILKKVS